MTTSLATRDTFETAVEDLGGLATPISLQLPDALKINDWRRLGAALDRLSDATLWWIADWAAHGERQYRRDYGAVLDRLAKGTVYNLASTSSRVEISRRRENLSIWHHSEVAKLDGLNQELWLDEAERRGWSVHELRAAINERTGKPERKPYLSIRAQDELYEACTSEAERHGLPTLEWAEQGLRWLASNGSPHLLENAA